KQPASKARTDQLTWVRSLRLDAKQDHRQDQANEKRAAGQKIKGHGRAQDQGQRGYGGGPLKALQHLRVPSTHGATWPKPPTASTAGSVCAICCRGWPRR